ncbi:MAG TPA: dihydrodipicolinate synthase family protein [Candidatus Brachybacterium merdavium]|uniref:Dihydrodipicolinate synthase family protein n=1 Tax=Candidatus Brachybacterium merdavium TaxID=2838513 RepID=A0A9D2LCV3_9MICO|nr:dihydrodipicolinate synthase family protein [Candidatus Brachybacterium merdavium]
MTDLEERTATDLRARLDTGVVIPAHPLALDDSGGLDLTAQRALTRYQLAAGAHGLAVGVHTTQFELHHDPGMLRTVWELAALTAAEAAPGQRPIMVAGLVGDTAQAVREAQIARELGYEAALMSPWGMSERSEPILLERAQAVGEVLPTIGFYLQDSVGGTPLTREFWRRLFELDSVVAVKVAPFDRYRTNDVLQELLVHDRWDQVAVLTGNDDAIVHDLLTPYRARVGGRLREVRARGGLLGQWAVGTKAAVELVARANAAVTADAIDQDLLALATDLVEVNAAVFDVAHDFAGCVPGVNEVLRQQGLVPTAACLGADLLSPGQSELIASMRSRYPELLDEQFVAEGRDAWLS